MHPVTRILCMLAAAALPAAGISARADGVPSPSAPPSAPAALPAPEPPLVPAAEPEPEPEPPDSPGPAERNAWRYIVIHHSASDGGNAAAFNRMHRRKGWDGLAYHFVITNGKGGPDGAVEVSARWWQQKHGAHAGALRGGYFPDERNDYNEFGIGICLVGNLERRPPTRAQMRALADLVGRLRRQFGIAETDIVGHGHVRATACPGRQFPWRTLFAMLQLSPPTHLHRRAEAPTLERCAWCFHHEGQVTRSMPANRPGRGSASADLPPPILLQAR